MDTGKSLNMQVSVMEQEHHREMNPETPEPMTEEKFLKDLYFFMKQRDSPIERIPHLGFKQINLYMMFKAVMEFGGYHQVTAQQLWKKVYNILGGNPRSTSAATCTRRHYEKLLLPYEYHLAGYRDNISITPPRQRKRFRSDEEFNLSTKRPDFTYLHHINPEQPHLFTQFIPPGPITVPTYLAVSIPPIPNRTSQLPTQPTVPFRPPSHPPSPTATGTVKRPLEFLRHLAQEYTSSSGWTEPLNLSRKPSRLELPRSMPSSFTSPAAYKRESKFLNKASEFNLANPSVLGISEAPVHLKSGDESQVINLTSSPPSSPGLWIMAPSSTPAPQQRLNYPSAVQTRLPEQGPQVPEGKLGSSATSQSSAGSITSNSALDSSTGMEIQIPLSLLQNWIKGGLLLNPASIQQHLLQTKPPSSPERTVLERSDSPSIDCPTDLSLKSQIKRLDISTDPTSAIERQAAHSGRFTYPKPLQIPQTTTVPFYSRVPNLRSPGLQDQDVCAKQVHFGATRNQEQPSLKSTAHVKAAAHSGAAKPEKEPEKLPSSFPLGRVKTTSAPFVQISPEHLKLLFTNVPLRLERGKIC